MTGGENWKNGGEVFAPSISAKKGSAPIILIIVIISIVYSFTFKIERW